MECHYTRIHAQGQAWALVACGGDNDAAHVFLCSLPQRQDSYGAAPLCSLSKCGTAAWRRW
jgi:hypothetical protein